MYNSIQLLTKLISQLDTKIIPKVCIEIFYTKIVHQTFISKFIPRFKKNLIKILYGIIAPKLDTRIQIKTYKIYANFYIKSLTLTQTTKRQDTLTNVKQHIINRLST